MAGQQPLRAKLDSDPGSTSSTTRNGMGEMGDCCCAIEPEVACLKIECCRPCAPDRPRGLHIDEPSKTRSADWCTASRRPTVASQSAQSDCHADMHPHTHAHAHIHTRIHVCIYACTHTIMPRTCTHMNTHAHPYTTIHTQRHACICVCTCTCTSVRTCTQRHAQTHARARMRL